jgi:hypothetical protein
MNQRVGMSRTMSRRGVLLLLPLALILPGLALAAGGAVGRVTRLAGAPSIMRPDGRTIVAALGMPLAGGDRVATGPGGRLEITMADGTTIIIGERTTLGLSRLIAPGPASPGEGLLDLLEGILHLQLPHPWNRFEVTTSTAVAAVRSTDWLIEAKADNTSVFVARGRVEVENRARTGAVLLDPAFGTDVAAGGLPVTPHRWSQARIDAALALTRIP